MRGRSCGYGAVLYRTRRHSKSKVGSLRNDWRVIERQCALLHGRFAVFVLPTGFRECVDFVSARH
jgi:hypothetical protein